MTKKKTRLILACTIMLPVWIAIGGVLCIFPSIIPTVAAPIIAAFLIIKLWVGEDLSQEDKKELKKQILGCIPLFFLPITAMIVCFYVFVETGEFPQ